MSEDLQVKYGIYGKKGVRLVNNLVLMKRKIFCFDFNGIKNNLSLRVKKNPYIMEKILKVQTVTYTENNNNNNNNNRGISLN